MSATPGAAEPAAVPLTLHQDQLLMPGELAGQPVYFQLVTHEFAVVIDFDDAQRLGLRPKPLDADSHTPDAPDAKTYLRNLRIGDISLSPHLVALTEGVGRDVQLGDGESVRVVGRIGFAAFQKQCVTVDLKRMRLLLTPGSAPHEATVAALHDDGFWVYPTVDAVLESIGGEATTTQITLALGEADHLRVPLEVMRPLNAPKRLGGLLVLSDGRTAPCQGFALQSVSLLGRQLRNVLVLSPDLSNLNDPPPVGARISRMHLQDEVIVFDAPNRRAWIVTDSLATPQAEAQLLNLPVYQR